MRAQSAGSFSAIDAVDQIGLVRPEIGSGTTCSSIQTAGSSIATENRRISLIAGATSPFAPATAEIRMTAAATAKTPSKRASPVIANIGVAASRMISRRKAIDKSENFGNAARLTNAGCSVAGDYRT